MTSRSAQRRRVPATIPLRLEARHGRCTFVYSGAARGAVRVIGEHERDPLKIAFPHLDPDTRIGLIPGLSAPEEVLSWASDAAGHIDGSIGDRVLVTAVCEHIREAEAARMGWDKTADLAELFEQHPTHWLVYAAMPTTHPADPA